MLRDVFFEGLPELTMRTTHGPKVSTCIRDMQAIADRGYTKFSIQSYNTTSPCASLIEG